MKSFRFPVLVLVFLSCLAAATGVAAPEDPAGIDIVVDPRIELTSIVFRLAGNAEYGKCRLPGYAADIDAHFGPFARHEAVEMARRLRARRGVAFNAVPELALRLTDPPALQERVSLDPLPTDMDDRWTGESARDFAAALRRFAADADFATFWADHADLYAVTVERMDGLVQEQGIPAWLRDFFGTGAGASSTIELALVNGPVSYGPRVQLPDGQVELHSVMGVWEADKSGVPLFRSRVLPAVVHEFAHSYVNPLVDGAAATLQPAGVKLYPLVAGELRKQAYPDWRTMMYESLVRATTVRWVAAAWGSEAAEKQAEYDHRRSFYWVGDLAGLLAEYEADRHLYPDLKTFMPRIAAFFDDWAAAGPARIAAIEARWAEAEKQLAARAPRIVSIDPPDGATGVDPGLKEIVVVFDRPMKDRSWSVAIVGDNFPEITGVGYDEGQTVFRMQVSLQPGRTYSYGLNGPNLNSFMDVEGNPLVPVTVEFSTR